jgi:hypothetical protein
MKHSTWMLVPLMLGAMLALIDCPDCAWLKWKPLSV